MELKQRKKEEEMLKQVKATMKEGKAKIEEKFDEVAKEFIDGLEREKRLVEGRYVSPYNSTEAEIY